ncbi:MAG: protein in Tap1-dppD intergenic region [Eubacteriales bacterium]|nr:protein in Tap1-dppD intergenic region [Eubacteriales bacterium]
MNHSEQRIWLIQELLKEDKNYKDMAIPKGVQEQKDLLRALMNVRMPKMISPKFIEVQDEYLKEEIQREGIVDVETLKPLKCDKRLYIWQGDMSTLKIDAVQNPANSGMTGCYQPLHNCLDNSIRI